MAKQGDSKQAAVARSRAPAAPQKPAATIDSAAVRIGRVVDRVRSTWNAMTGAQVELGRAVITEIFGGSANAAYDLAPPVPAEWEELCDRVDALGVRLDASVLSRLVRVAALDELLRGSRHWPDLDLTQKVELLPLREPKLILQAARHADQMEPTVENLRTYVAGLREKHGLRRERRVSLATMRRPLRTLGAALDDASIARLVEEADDLDDDALDELAQSVEQALNGLRVLQRKLRR